MAPAFEKRKLLFVSLAGKETGSTAQICLPDSGFRLRFKGFQHWIFPDNRSFTSERVLAFRLWLCLSPVVPWWGALKASKVLSDISKVLLETG